MFIAFEKTIKPTPFGRAEFKIAFSYQQSLPQVRPERGKMN
jgi:hypothetical protein